MKLYEASLIIIVAMIGAIALAGFASQFFIGKDNIVEQEAEAFIHEETGIYVDLSP